LVLQIEGLRDAGKWPTCRQESGVCPRVWRCSIRFGRPTWCQASRGQKAR